MRGGTVYLVNLSSLRKEGADAFANLGSVAWGLGQLVVVQALSLGASGAVPMRRDSKGRITPVIRFFMS